MRESAKSWKCAFSPGSQHGGAYNIMREPASKLDWEQIQSALGRALDLAEEQRAAYLKQQPPSIRAEVESLVAAWRRSTRVFGPETGTQELLPPVSRRVSIDAGTQLGPYRIETLIGHGGMGAVYRALDSRLNRLVAIKFLFDDVADSAARRQFQLEAQMASSLNHSHILTVHDVGDFDGRPYLVTEFIDGGTLKDWVRAEKPAWRQTIE